MLDTLSSLLLAWPWDWFLYLFLMQHIPIIGVLYYHRTYIAACTKNEGKVYLWIYLIALVCLWLIYSGYSTDAPRYLTRFERSPFSFKEEQLFWFTAYTLNNYLTSPWAFKILSAVACVLISAGYLVNLKPENNATKLIVLWCLILLPSFYFLEGNVIRQGLSVGLMLMFGYCLQINKWLFAICLVITAYLIHQYVLIIALILSIVRFAPGYGAYCILFGILIACFGDDIASFFDVQVQHFIPYYWQSYGHVYKLIGYSCFAVFFFVILRSSYLLTKTDKYWINCFLYLYALSLVFAQYEIPFERISLSYQLLIPLCLVFIFRGHKRYLKQSMSTMGVINIISLGLWSSGAILVTMGFR